MADAKSEAKRLLNYLFRIPARVPEDYSFDTISNLVDLIIKAAVEEVEYNSRNPQTEALPCTLYGSSKTEGKP